MSIGTAKPSVEEQQGVRHYFIDSHSIKNELTVAEFAKDANSILNDEFQNHDNILLVGGSGLFVDAICFGLDDIPSSEKIRDEINEELLENGLEYLKIELKNKDPEYYAQVDLSNPHRIVRAIEVLRLSGQTYSSLRTSSKQQHDFEIKRFVIDHPREALYDRINNRVAIMMESGLLDEVNSLIAYKNLQALQTVGYKELFAFIDKQCTLDEAIEKIKQHTRNYAKRQLTWCRRYDDATWISYSDPIRMAQEIYKMM